MKNKIFPFIAALCLLACHEAQPKTEVSATAVHDSIPKLKADMVSNKKDPVCGMPLTAGIGDTVTYKGKVYGFCSKECRDSFLKSPEAYIVKGK